MDVSAIIIGSVSKEQYGRHVLFVFYYYYSLFFFRPRHFGIEGVVIETLKRANSIENCEG